MNLIQNDDRQPMVFYHGTRRQFSEPHPQGESRCIFFSSSRKQAKEFAEYPRGEANSAEIGVPRILWAYLKSDCLFDARDQKQLNSLRNLDWNQLRTEMENFSQSDWTQPELERWLMRGEWQILEQPSVLALLRENGFDAMLVYELGVANVAVFSTQQVVLLPEPTIRPRFR